jgi:hypothetical protein
MLQRLCRKVVSHSDDQNPVPLLNPKIHYREQSLQKDVLLTPMSTIYAYAIFF